MTVKQLIEELKKLPQDLPVLQAKDSEGNGFYDTLDAYETWFDGDYPVDESDYDEQYISMHGTLERVVILWP